MLIVKLYLDFILKNNFYQKNSFLNIEKSIIKFINSIKRVLNFKKLINIDIN